MRARHHTFLLFTLLLAAGLGAFVTARAQTVLVWSMGNSQSGTQTVANYLQASGNFSSVTAFDGTGLTLSTLAAYDEVLFFSNGGGDPLAGDALADFADTGRRLVIATFSYANQGGNTLGGRIITAGISPVVFVGSTLYSSAVLGPNDGSGLFTGVTNLSSIYRDNVTPTSGAVVRGVWSDGVPLVTTKGNVVAITLFPDATAGSLSGDYAQLFTNSLVAAVPEPSTYVLLALGAGGLAWFRRRRA